MKIINVDDAIELAYSCTEENKRPVMQELMRFIFDCIQTGNKEELNLLLTFDVSKTKLYISSTILRTTFAYSSKLNNWHTARNNVVAYCKDNATPKWEIMLRGLLNDEPYVNPWGEELDKLSGVHPTFARQQEEPKCLKPKKSRLVLYLVNLVKKLWIKLN